jgi:hypothetical protein
VKGDEENLVVQFHTFLNEQEIRDCLAKLNETNEHMAGYEILSITPPENSTGSPRKESDSTSSDDKTGGDSQ